MAEIRGIKLLAVQWRKLADNVLLRRLLTVLSLDILVKTSSVILLPLYLRLMQQEGYGVFNYILSIVYSFATVLNLGLYVPQSKIYHDYHDAASKGKLLFNINVLMAAGLLVIIVPAYLFKFDYSVIHFLFKNVVDYQRYRIWILVVTLISLLAYMLTNFLYTSEQINVVKRYSIYRIILVNAISLGALLYFRKDDSIAVRIIVIACVETVLLVIFYRYYIKPMRPVFDFGLIGKSLKMGMPMMVSSLFSIVINFGDKFFLEKYVDYKGLSVYYLAFSCVSVIPLLSNSLQNVWLPLFLKEKDLARNLARTKKMVKRLVAVLGALSLAVILGVFLCLQWNIIPSSYTAALYVLPPLLLSQILLCLALICYNYLIYFEKTNMVLIAGLVISVISVLLNLLLIPAWKMYGAAVTSLVSNGLYLFIYYFAVKVYKKKHPTT